jgi:hypothetical protein
MTGRAPHTAAVSPPAAHIERASALCLRPAPGKLAGFFGTGAHRLALRALARPLVAGEPVVAVDGGNRFDPYEISKAERALGGNGRVALSRILVSRAFTCHQMEALLCTEAGIAVVLGLPETFTDADVPFAEACRVFRNCLSSLCQLAAHGVRVVLVGEGDARGISGGESPGSPASPFAAVSADSGDKSRGGGNRAGFFRHLARIADPCLLLHREGEEWRATLRGSRAGNAGSVPWKGKR